MIKNLTTADVYQVIGNVPDIQVALRTGHSKRVELTFSPMRKILTLSRTALVVQFDAMDHDDVMLAVSMFNEAASGIR